MSSEITIDLDQGYSVPFEDTQLRIHSAHWDLLLQPRGDHEIIQRVLLTITMDNKQARAFGQRFAPVLQALEKGHTRYRLELAPDAREALNARIDAVLAPGDWLGLGDAGLMRLENYIYLLSLAAPASA